MPYFEATAFRMHFDVCQNPHLITMSHTVLTNKEIAFQINNKVTQVTLRLTAFSSSHE